MEVTVNEVQKRDLQFSREQYVHQTNKKDFKKNLTHANTTQKPKEEKKKSDPTTLKKFTKIWRISTTEQFACNNLDF